MILLAAVVACAGPAAGEEYRLVGDTEAVWLIESAEGQYELAAKPLDKPWVSHWGAKSGDISAAAAVRDSVVLFFAQGGHARYFAHGPEGRPGINAPKHLWPAGTIAVAACPAGGGEFDAVLVLVSNPERGFSAAGPRPLPGTRTTESTRPAATATSLPQAATMQTARGPLALLRYAGQQWEQLAVVPDRFVHPPFRAHMARHEGAVYVLLDQKPTSALIVFEHGAWGRLRLPEDAAGIKPLALLGMPEGIALAAFASEGRVGIARWASGRWSGLQVVRRDDQPLSWPVDSPPTVARLAQSFALAWRDGQQWLFGTCGSDGRISPKRVSIFENGMAARDAANILQYFFTAVLVLLIVLMFWPGQPVRTAPFSLPPTMLPARMSKRVIAFVVDALPFMILTNLITGGAHEVNVTWEMVRKGNVPGLVYAYVAFLGAYPVYCLLMESRYGATLGKMAMRLRVVGDGGRRPLLREIALRNISKIPELMAMLLVIPILFPVLTRYRQRLGDKIAWTTVIDAESSVPLEALGDSAERPGGELESKEEEEP